MNAFQNENLKTIGIFNDSFPPIMDGVSLTTRNYAHWLHEKHQPVCVITPRTPNYTDDELYPVYRYSSVPIYGRKPYRFGLPEIDFSFKNTIDNVQFGLVHAHCPFSSGNAALRIAKEQKVPMVATFHSKYREDFEHSVHNKFIVNLMVKEIIRFYEKADEVWISQASVEETIREYGFKGKVELVGMGNDFDTKEPIEEIKKQAREELHITGNEIVFLFVGQLIWEKNIRLIVESLAMIKDLSFKMFFIGSGYAQEGLKELVSQFGLSSKVEFVGSIADRDRLKTYYAAADLFLLPSIYDTWAIVIHEAAALQTPSVLVSKSTIGKMITDNENGFLTENSSESIALRLRELVSKPKLIRHAGLRASQTLNRTWENVTDEVLDRYQHLGMRLSKR